MAEAFLTHEAAVRGLDVSVRSVGTHAFGGRRSSIEARSVMRQLGVPIDEHWTTELVGADFGWTDLMVCLAGDHERDVKKMNPEAVPKVFLLTQLVRMLEEDPDDAGVGVWMKRLNGSRPANEVDRDVDDPLGNSESHYMAVAVEIRGLVSALAGEFEKRGT